MVVGADAFYVSLVCHDANIGHEKEKGRSSFLKKRRPSFQANARRAAPHEGK
jgi:hypothetical protein